MGNKKTKPAPAPAPGQPAVPQPKPSVLPPKSPEPSEADYSFLTAQTGLSRSEIKATFDKFIAGNPDAKLDKQEFIKLYSELRPEPADKLDEISVSVFKCFDSGNMSIYNLLSLDYSFF